MLILDGASARNADAAALLLDGAWPLARLAQQSVLEEDAHMQAAVSVFSLKGGEG